MRLCNLDLLYACGTNPGHQAPNVISINILPGHQAPNIIELKLQGIKPPTWNSKTSKDQLKSQNYEIWVALWSCSLWRVHLFAMASCKEQLARRGKVAREASDEVHHSLWRGS
ncbi:hypothetical protein MTR_1g476010 [Medicago truncatula]|uniref:Uncharacterized protein n=1 Tax=Medicago truncatula TaxID=3880 RepID=A0A072VXE6_MEDTR|nr:hypothetical protein MTR_1g476010 [Medicago truncatula]